MKEVLGLARPAHQTVSQNLRVPPLPALPCPAAATAMPNGGLNSEEGGGGGSVGPCQINISVCDNDDLDAKTQEQAAAAGAAGAPGLQQHLEPQSSGGLGQAPAQMQLHCQDQQGADDSGSHLLASSHMNPSACAWQQPVQQPVSAGLSDTAQTPWQQAMQQFAASQHQQGQQQVRDG